MEDIQRHARTMDTVKHNSRNIQKRPPNNLESRSPEIMDSISVRQELNMSQLDVVDPSP